MQLKGDSGNPSLYLLIWELKAGKDSVSEYV